MIRILTLLVLFVCSQNLWAQYHVENPPQPCQCQFAGKDYDPAKGYYFDRVSWLPYPHVSGRFGCTYYCRDSEDHYWNVTHVYEGSYLGTQKGGPENAKKMICPQAIAKFIPKYDLVGQVEYYETEPVGNFSAMKSSIPEVISFAQRHCGQ